MKLKKVLAPFLALALAAALLAGCAAGGAPLDAALADTEASAPPRLARELAPATVENGYAYALADGTAAVVGFEDPAGDGSFAPPATLGGAPVTQIGGGETPIAGVEAIRSIDLSALSGYTVARQAFAGVPVTDSVDLSTAAAIGEGAFGGSAAVPVLRADDALTVGQNAFSGAGFVLVNADSATQAGAFAADGGGRRPGLSGLRVLVKTSGQYAAGVTAEDSWIMGTGGGGFYSLSVTAADPGAQQGYTAVAGSGFDVAVISYDSTGAAVQTAFSSAEYPVSLHIPVPAPANGQAYLLATDGTLAAEGTPLRDGKALVSLQNLAATGSLIGLFTQNEAPPEPIPVTGVAITTAPANNQLAVGSTFALGATVSPEDATNKALTWASGNTGVLTVDANGNLSAIAAGTATVTATAADGSGVSGSVDITVTGGGSVPVTGVAITTLPTGNQLRYGDSFALAATVQPADATDKSLTWSSANAGVVAVDANGRITAKAVGKTTITATAKDGSGVAGSAEITVTARSVKVNGITAATRAYDGTTTATLDTTRATFEGAVSGDALSVTATGAFADANPGTGKAVTLSNLKLGGAAAGNYTLDSASQKTATAEITKRPLTVGAPSLTTQKVYDGNATAAVTMGAVSGILQQDAGSVQVTATAAYDSAEVGTGKRITVTYALQGAKAGYYTAPAAFTTSNGQIMPQGAAGSPTNLTEASVVSHSGDSIVLAGVGGQLYAIGEGGQYGHYESGAFVEGWLDAGSDGSQITFAGLIPNRAYTLYTREAFDEAHESPSAISAPLEVMLYTAGQQKVIDEVDPLGAGITDRDGAAALVAATQDFEALPAEESATLEQRLQMADRLAQLQSQAAAVNHTSGSVSVSGDGLAWYARLEAQELNAGNSQWALLQEKAEGLQVLDATSVALTDLTTGGNYTLPEGGSLQVSLPMPAGADGQQLRIIRTNSANSIDTITPTVVGDKLVFTTDGPGIYAVATPAGGAISQPEENTGNGPSAWVIVLIVVLALALVALGVVLWLRARNRRAGQ